nr:hypothetical protein Iba_chr11aCG0250 [Ipomoea batatas]GMD56196.1 hypothetical protein Iba_chr11eCG0880 [Ipomoea batatas]GMD58045.1 hypothetical protein Iba_chr11fCG1810 [Ipomoea batatas]
MEREGEEEATKNERPIFLLSPSLWTAGLEGRRENEGGRERRKSRTVPSDLFIGICISCPCLLFFLCFWLMGVDLCTCNGGVYGIPFFFTRATKSSPLGC